MKNTSVSRMTPFHPRLSNEFGLLAFGSRSCVFSDTYMHPNHTVSLQQENSVLEREVVIITNKFNWRVKSLFIKLVSSELKHHLINLIYYLFIRAATGKDGRYFDNPLIVPVIYQAEMPNVCWFQILKDSYPLLIVNEESLCFRPLVCHKKQFKVTFQSWNQS